jgi:hypothetical protein
VINLVRDVLDQLLVDAKDRYVGRVDGIILERRRNKPPRVAALEISGTTLARRVHPLLGKMIRALERRLGIEPVHLPTSAVERFGLDIHLNVVGESDRRLLQFEKRLSRTVIQHIPGGRK